MAKELVTNPREMELLRQLHTSFAQAQREFTIAFSMFCAQHEISDVTFLGFTAQGVLLGEKEPDG